MATSWSDMRYAVLTVKSRCIKQSALCGILICT
jgi:hypothetical protein